MGDQSTLDGTTWTLTGWGEAAELPESVQISAEFADAKVYGTSGINRFNSSVTTEGDVGGVGGTDAKVSFGPVMMTRMVGPEDAMQAEQRFVRRLEAVTAYRLTGDQLVLVDGDGADSLIMTAQGTIEST